VAQKVYSQNGETNCCAQELPREPLAAKDDIPAARPPAPDGAAVGGAKSWARRRRTRREGKDAEGRTGVDKEGSAREGVGDVAQLAGADGADDAPDS